MFGAKKVREVLKASNGNVARNTIYKVLGAEQESDYAKIRYALSDMIKRGEVVWIEQDLFKYNHKYTRRAGNANEKIYRFIRQQKEGWSVNNCVLLSSVDYSYAKKYIAHLLLEGYIEVIGKKVNNKLYRATKKAMQNPETPIFHRKKQGE